MAGSSSARFNRLLAMVPYFTTHSGIPIDQAARDLGVTRAQLVKDLEQLFVCGLPGYFPDDLIDLQFEQGVVEVGFTAGMDRPLRLTTTEASTLLVALRTLVDSSGAVDRPAASRAIAKIEEAVGSATSTVAGGEETDADHPVFSVLRAAVRDRRALRIRYYSATRDSISERVVDPIRVQMMDNNTYLEAWCRSAEGTRLFRFDRVESATELDEPAAPPAEAAERRQPVLVSENPDLPSVDIEIDPSELWILDYYTVESLENLSDRPDPARPVRARLVYGSTDWLRRFVLGFGGKVRVTSDPDVTERVTAAAAAARARYR